jgi:FixJ family two-component response regulator
LRSEIGAEHDLRLKKIDLSEAGTILIAVGDGVLADSLRFSLELEGFEVKLCDEPSLLGALAAPEAPGCLVLDQDRFARMVDGKGGRRLAEFDVPVVLMVGHKTERVLARAKAAGVTEVVEEPLFGGVLCEAIRTTLRKAPSDGPAHRSY